MNSVKFSELMDLFLSDYIVSIRTLRKDKELPLQEATAISR